MIYGCFGCQFGFEPANKSIQLPLQSISYQITLLNAIAQIQIRQKYVNKKDKILCLEYKFPNIPQTCLHKLVAIFPNKRFQGIVKQKQQAKVQYVQSLKHAKKAILATTDSQNSNIMKVQIGNIQPGQEVSIQFSYIQELSIRLNTFYQFNLNINHYMQFAQNIGNHLFNQNQKEVNCNFKLNLKTQTKIVSFKSPTNKLVVNKINDQKTFYQFSLGDKLSQTFTFMFTTIDFQLPSYTLGRTDVGSSVMISFIPKFCKLSVGDAEAAALQQTLYDVQMDSVKGQYIFFLDRSGSMGGKRIKNAKKALILFLKSLPIHTYFNVISFGSKYRKLFPQSRKNSQQSIKTALIQIEQMDADLGGTQILAPIRQVFNSQSIYGYPRQLFLLTDGEINDRVAVIDLIKKNVRNTRVNTIGIGADASEDLIVDCAEKGKGIHVFIEDNQNFSQKIIKILNDTLTPVVNDVSLFYDKAIVQSVIPNPKKMPYILKNEVVNFYITFKGQLTQPTTISFNYTDSLNNIPFSSQINISPDSESQSFVNKMAYFKQIKAYEQDDEEGISNYQQFAKTINIKDQIIKLSLRSQILSKYTAFICAQTELSDGKYSQIKSKKIQKIQIIQASKKYKHFDNFQFSLDMSKQSYLPPAKPNQLNLLDDCFNFKQQYFQSNSYAINDDLVNFDCQFTNCAIQSILPPSNNFNDFGFDGFQYGTPSIISQTQKKQEYNFDLLGQISEIKSKSQIKNNKIEEVIKAQHFDGKWDSLQLILMIFGEQLKDKIKDLPQKNVIITFLLIRWMQKHHQQAEYKLIIKKGRNWLQKQAEFIQLSIIYEQYVK